MDFVVVDLLLVLALHAQPRASICLRMTLTLLWNVASDRRRDRKWNLNGWKWNPSVSLGRPVMFDGNGLATDCTCCRVKMKPRGRGASS